VDAAHGCREAEAGMQAEWKRKAASGEQWTEADAREAIGRWLSRGGSLAAFARQHGVVAQRMAWWRHRLGERERERGGVALVPVTVTGSVGVGALGASVRVSIGEVVVEAQQVASLPPSWVAALALKLGEAGS
jgi:transposase-like protein